MTKIDHPQYYNNLGTSGIECIDVVEWMNFNIGNVIKYCWRAGLKTDNAIEDLEKAAWYIQREINRLKDETKIPRKS